MFIKIIVLPYNVYFYRYYITRKQGSHAIFNIRLLEEIFGLLKKALVKLTPICYTEFDK